MKAHIWPFTTSCNTTWSIVKCAPRENVIICYFGRGWLGHSVYKVLLTSEIATVIFIPLLSEMCISPRHYNGLSSNMLTGPTVKTARGRMLKKLCFSHISKCTYIQKNSSRLIKYCKEWSIMINVRYKLQPHLELVWLP